MKGRPVAAVTGSSTRIPISCDSDIVLARQQGRSLSAQIGFSAIDQTVIATAISEIARNIIEHANQGEIVLTVLNHGPGRGLQVVALDQGPGIPDLAKAMQDDYSTGKGLGLGLPGSRRLMDEFEIESEVGRGTTVTMRKWRRE